MASPPDRSGDISPAAEQPGSAPAPPPLRLVNRAGESDSAYVRTHQADLVAWQLWDAESLYLARSTGRLIFLNVSFSACHWCSVMTLESFNNPEIAEKINSCFIPVIVDRDDRPDLDRVYMNYVQASTGTGGWPLNVFLTPTLAPIFGGTYFPPAPGAGLLAGGTSAMSGTTANAGQLRRPSSLAGPLSPTFPVVLGRIYASWATDRKSCEESGRQMVAQLREFAAEGMISREGRKESFLDRQTNRPQLADIRPLASPSPPDQFVAFEEDPAQMLELDLLDEAYEHFVGRYDKSFSGFGFQPKFPCPTNLDFLLQLSAWPKPVEDIVGEDCVGNAKSIVLATLKTMFRAGIWDQLGAGFHRYSASRNWLVPHYEKMLYDQALLLKCYTKAHVLTKDETCLDVVVSLSKFLHTGPLSSTNGAFFSTQSSESASPADQSILEEGKYYTWTLAEITRLLGPDDGKLLAKHFGIVEDGNVPPEFDVLGELQGSNVLSISKTAAELADELGLALEQVESKIEAGKKKLLERRQSRPAPCVDKKVIAGWNGLAIGALALSGKTLQAHEDESIREVGARSLEKAVSAARHIKSHLWDETAAVLYRRRSEETQEKLAAFAEDYAYLISGLLELYQATWDATWLQWAAALMEAQISKFHDTQNDGFFATVEESIAPQTSTSKGQHRLPDMIIRLKDGMDTAEPSTNGLTAQNLFQLSSLLGNNDRYARLARRTIMAFEAEILQHPFLFATFLGAVVVANEGIGSVVVTGKDDGSEGAATVRSALRQAAPALVSGTWSVVWADLEPSESNRFLLAKHPMLRQLAKVKVEANKDETPAEGGLATEDGLSEPIPAPVGPSQGGQIAVYVCRPQPTVPSGSPVVARACEVVKPEDLLGILMGASAEAAE